MTAWSLELKGSLWSRWVLANAVGELIGLGFTFAIGVGLFSGLSESPGAFPAILSALLMTSSGALEGAVVGLAQWWVMRAAFPQLTRRSWVIATVIGAVAAWFLGAIPMTVSSLSDPGQQQAAQEPEAAMMLLMAAGMGLFAGLVLSLAQWCVLRRFAAKAWLWLPANSLAWAAGLPIIFAAIDQAQKAGSLAGGIAVMAASLAIAGAVVGAVHGVVLVRLAHQAGRRLPS